MTILKRKAGWVVARGLIAAVPAGLAGFGGLVFAHADIPSSVEGWLWGCCRAPAFVVYFILFALLWLCPDPK